MNDETKRAEKMEEMIKEYEESSKRFEKQSNKQNAIGAACMFAGWGLIVYAANLIYSAGFNEMKSKTMKKWAELVNSLKHTWDDQDKFNDLRKAFFEEHKND